jgi:hypothetical protein
VRPHDDAEVTAGPLRSVASADEAPDEGGVDEGRLGEVDAHHLVSLDEPAEELESGVDGGHVVLAAADRPGLAGRGKMRVMATSPVLNRV